MARTSVADGPMWRETNESGCERTEGTGRLLTGRRGRTGKSRKNDKIEAVKRNGALEFAGVALLSAALAWLRLS
ncbi:MAG TPA: hypothetical protein VHE78_06120 [Gemmatimonadaceae bacterium]|nr:hypothetical protein [Gemmatimonadaceae bacterium]